MLEIFDLCTPAISKIAPSCSALASPLLFDFAMDTSDLHTYSTNEDMFRTDDTTCIFLTTSRIRPSTYINDLGRPIQPSGLNGSLDTNKTSLLIRSDVKCSPIKIPAEDENIRKLNKLRDYYKSQIKELPPLHQTTAAIISNISSRVGGASSKPLFHYHNTIETSEKNAPLKFKEEVFKPKGETFKPNFNSTANYGKGQIKCPNNNEYYTYNEKSQLSWRDYVSSENKSKRSSRTYTVERTKRTSRSNKSLQTMLTMENVTKLSEMLEKVNKNETYCVDNKIEKSETFRLTRSVSMVQSSSNMYGTAEECFPELGVDLSNNDLNGWQLTDGVRASVINWLFRLDYTGGNAVTLQCAIRFLDELGALCEGTLPDSVLTCGAACFWVASKLQSARVPGAASIARQCGGVFTPQQLVICERRVLAKLAFPSAPVVPADEVERLAHVWDVHESGVIRIAHDMCCYALLYSHLAALASIQLAGAALATALQLLQPRHPLVPHLHLLRSDEDGWSVALEEELKQVYEYSDGEALSTSNAERSHSTHVY